MTYHCDICEHVATTARNLRNHIESKHEGVRHLCHKCEYTATRLGDLQNHIKIKHEELRYPCGKCEYTASTAGEEIKKEEFTFKENDEVMSDIF